MPTEKGARRQCITVGSPRLRVAPRLRLGGTRRRVHEGGKPPQTPPLVQGSGFGTPLRGGRRKPLADNPRINLRRDLSKERVDGSLRSHRPSSQSVFWLHRRVNSAAGERVGLDLLRRPRRPVVTACYIDPSTRTERTSFALRLRLRRRSRAAARPSACADTRAPSVANASRAC